MQWVKGSFIEAAVEWVAAVTGIQSLAQELPYANGVAIKKKKKGNLMNNSKYMA